MPTQSQFVYSPYLSNISTQYQNGDLYGELLAPPTPVGTRTGQYLTYGMEHFRTHETRWADRTRANEIDWSFSQATFATIRYALSGSVSDMERDQVGNVPFLNLNLEKETIELVTDSLQLERERRIATLLRASSALGAEATLSGTSQWSDYTNSDPFTNIRAGRASIQTLTGKVPNTAIIPFPVMEILTEHPKVLTLMNVVTDKVVTTDVLKRLFNVENIYVPTAQYDTANYGAASSLSPVWGKDVILAYVAPSIGVKTQTLAATFRYSPGPGPVMRWREEDRQVDMFRVTYEEDNRIISPGAGYIIRNAVA